MVVAPSRLECTLPCIVALERVRIFQAEIHRHRHARTLPVETAPALARIPQRGEVLEHLVRRCRVMAHRRNQHGPIRFHREIRSEEHTSELQSLMRSSYAVFCLKKKNTSPYD